MNSIYRLTKVFFVLLASTLSAPFAFAADVKPVEWAAQLSEVEQGRATLTVSGIIAENWHIYGFEMPDLGEDAGVPEPTKLTMTLPSGVKAVGVVQHQGNCETRFDDFMNLNLPWLTGKVTFTQDLNIANGTDGNIEGTVSYMACTEKTCTPPDKYTFSLAVSSRRNLSESSSDNADIKSKTNPVHPKEDTSDIKEETETDSHYSLDGYLKRLGLSAIIVLLGAFAMLTVRSTEERKRQPVWRYAVAFVFMSLALSLLPLLWSF